MSCVSVDYVCLRDRDEDCKIPEEGMIIAGKGLNRRRGFYTSLHPSRVSCSGGLIPTRLRWCWARCWGGVVRSRGGRVIVLADMAYCLYSSSHQKWMGSLFLFVCCWCSFCYGMVSKRPNRRTRLFSVGCFRVELGAFTII